MRRPPANRELLVSQLAEPSSHVVAFLCFVFLLCVWVSLSGGFRFRFEMSSSKQETFRSRGCLGARLTSFWGGLGKKSLLRQSAIYLLQCDRKPRVRQEWWLPRALKLSGLNEALYSGCVGNLGCWWWFRMISGGVWRFLGLSLPALHSQLPGCCGTGEWVRFRI